MKVNILYKTLLLSLVPSLISAIPHNGVDHGSPTTHMMPNAASEGLREEYNSTTIIPTPYAMAHMHGQPILEQAGLTPAQKLYWESYNTTTFLNSDMGNRSALKFHTVSLIVIAAFIYPICLVLNNVESNWYLPLLTVNFGLTIMSLTALQVFVTSFQDTLYPGNLYRPVSYILLILASIHYISAVVYCAIKWMPKGYNQVLTYENGETHNTSIPLQEFHSHSEESTASSNFLSDVPNISTDVNNNNNNNDIHKNNFNSEANIDNFDIEDQNTPFQDGQTLRSKHFKGQHQSRNEILEKVYDQPIIQILSNRFGTLFELTFNLLNYPLFVYYLIYITIGLTVGNLFGKGQRKFNLLAHFIKGGVFILLGFVSLARYCGFGQKRGWAWNRIIIYRRDVTPQNSKLFGFITLPKGTITMEGLESFLIFFYGSTNVFLEHLAGAGGAWTAKDLQHVSIAFMYIGTGLCGLLAEKNLNEKNFKTVIENANKNNIDGEIIHEEDVFACSGGYSPNPFPAFTIFWTGILMSQHAQASTTSTAIHIQWGSLLSYGSFFRIFTFLILFFVPNKNSSPSRPLTELITSFCMLSGGLIFMESTDQVIEAMEYRGYTPMFTFNVSVGFVALVMAWEMILFMWRDYLKNHNSTN
ncbi:hypothetical protein TPHA_0H02260 [Tetrapisispora phaffii CBS 4417]|uniref:Protein YTP1-like C-terminal domain-containing protein n=1 Tax=Tetrapisispora phaffii (strain ATCC 24235 / CBS 4417 / NBRC 1672 / NRRL Y-8282 / UCD 70-5) TaxID=1071381 RepID=G8BWH9_TETPH|nr:hypothetical protein TPHA_0H02260 [Tetrapisispora phaffii CBS 4417]CCE64430.1 hypothetical protein TPHA_0H02260 [Tetrapisispora phaffii CBS 4417]